MSYTYLYSYIYIHLYLYIYARITYNTHRMKESIIFKSKYTLDIHIYNIKPFFLEIKLGKTRGTVLGSSSRPWRGAWCPLEVRKRWSHPWSRPWPGPCQHFPPSSRPWHVTVGLFPYQSRPWGSSSIALEGKNTTLHFPTCFRFDPWLV